MKKRTPIIITITLIILIVLSLIIAVINKSADSNKEDKKTSNTESSQEVKESESESLTEGDKLVDGEVQEDVTTGTGKTQMVTLENGITYELGSDGKIRMTAAEYREALKIDPTFMEHLDRDADGMTYDDYKERQANGTLTFEDMVNLDSGEMSDEEYEKRVEDGFIYGDKKKDENGATYIVLDDGTIIESGDVLPNGDVFTDSSQW